MPSEPLSIGIKIEARCTKCRKNCEHVLISLSDGKPDLVQCRICDRQHKFRPPTKAKKVNSVSLTEKKAAENKKWKQLSSEVKPAKARAYSMNEGYKNNTLVDHPTFGIGIVQRVTGTQKMEILFEDGLKILRCK